MKFNLVNRLVNQDIFGAPISVHFQGSESYQTKLGAFCTISTYILALVNSINLTMAFLDHSNQEERTSRTRVDDFY